MDHKYIAFSFLTLLAIIVVYLHYNHAEHFATKREKAQAILNWFKTTNDIDYDHYRKYMNSNVVEYTDVLNLYRNNNLTIDSIEKVL